MTGARRIGLLGGTLDPIHVGHLDAAEAARKALSLDEVLVIPAHDPPHRSGDPHASAFHRYAMVSLAIDGRPGYRASDLELRRNGPSYTALTLRDLRAQGWEPSQLYFIIGADAFAEIATWFEYPAILDACQFALVSRPGTTIDDALRRAPELRHRVGQTIHLVPAETSPASSSEIRARLAAGEPVEGLVPPAVMRHIATHHLYKTVNELHGQD
ncbi:MAG: nicotinate-nucleotide adenylyltransferase [Steroidobacteraceae bacterium]